MKFLVTGGAGFIGANFLNRFVPQHPEHRFLNVDAMTYAGNSQNLEVISGHPNYSFEQIDIADRRELEYVFREYNPDTIVHFAAESHVDRSIADPEAFIRTNIIGTFQLLELARISWQAAGLHLFHHVSTDEVYGSLGKDGYFTEESPYSPNSPYSASKASSDHLVRAYSHTYGLPVTLTNCSNNYGPYQHGEKLIPTVLRKLLHGEPVPIYGDGSNVRDWLYVEDHCDAIWQVIHKGRRGETYVVGGNNEKSNLELALELCEIVADYTGRDVQALRQLITFVADRAGHDQRYAIQATKIKSELGWEPAQSLTSGLRKTVEWYLANPLRLQTEVVVQ
ncbi:dTDP-glucose 4,6-dehydratase [Paenibacillus zeisoli]|uniref:dTDP-glucose 4,6-dehydratase n=1 Tax=Paenibacillus zeisoli TaxID=2496267 RepID=A0A3S1B6E0_9BACL|nr:dTDP-glucose 4,6-dehydratase [Paenibacillus zeisoli]RUT29634.1 dTDP-glucose 4,6-dehydratase [Paenibacillus zeisoli]